MTESSEGKAEASKQAVRKRARSSMISALLKARRRFGANREIVLDADGRRLTFGQFTQATYALGRALTRGNRRGEHVGVMLPTSAGALISFFALSAYGRTPAMINFTAGEAGVRAACRIAQIRQVITARVFVERAGLEKLVEAISQHAEVIYLEDVRETIGTLDKLAAIIGPYAPFLFGGTASPDAPCAVLFTSGTEGDPKGVVLSHANILANVAQIDEHVEFTPSDILFNPLPTFHCFGLTGALFPFLTGRTLALYPSPLHSKEIPKRIQEVKATVLIATDTFLHQYARSSDDEALRTLRLAVCGAERVRDNTREMVRRKIGLEVLEGYGVTEASPVLAANQPGDIRAGTVGKLIPDIEYKLEPVEGMEDAGRLFVRGPNIMLGYLAADRPGELRPLREEWAEGASEDTQGWHDTGDIVSFDKDGHMSIRGRAKRFANIGGEMVSLAVVENCATAAWPDNMHAAVVLPDDRKGEQIVLLTDYKDAERARYLTWAQSHGVSELAAPRKILYAPEIPLLGTGKVHYVEVGRIVERLLKAAKNGTAVPPGEAATPIATTSAETTPEEKGAPESADIEPENKNGDSPTA